MRPNLAAGVRARSAEPAAEVRGHGGCTAQRHEAHLAHAGHGCVHGVHARAVRPTDTKAAGIMVQPVDVQRAGVHARSAAEPQVAGNRVPAGAELQHDVLRVAEHQVPDRRGAPVRHQSILPGPGRRAAAPGADRHQRPRHDAARGIGHRVSTCSSLISLQPSRLHAKTHHDNIYYKL